MQIKAQYRKHSTSFPCATRRGQRGVFCPNQGMARARRSLILASALSTICVLLALPCGAQNVKLQQAATGIPFAGGNGVHPFTAGFGNVNGLGIGTPETGLTKISVSGGEFYYTPYVLAVSGAGGGNPALVKAYVSSQFTNPSGVLQLYSCAYPGSCTSFSNYTAMPISQATEITVLPNQANNGNYTAYLGLFVGDTNGGITSPDSAQITFDVYNGSNNSKTGTTILNLNAPSVSIQTAVQLQLLTTGIISAGSDYTAAFGTVNGLGIGPGANITVVNGQVANGSLYTTQYTMEPAFSGFSSTTNTKISAYVSTNFVHSTILQLYDSASSNSGYAALSTSSSSPTSLNSSVTNGTNITRYLGLFVSNVNGAGSFRGSDSATLTYTITVQ